jgi:hypothetical protein
VVPSSASIVRAYRSASGSTLAHCLSALNLLAGGMTGQRRLRRPRFEVRIAQGRDRAPGLAALAPEPLAGLDLRRRSLAQDDGRLAVGAAAFPVCLSRRGGCGRRSRLGPSRPRTTPLAALLRGAPHPFRPCGALARWSRASWSHFAAHPRLCGEALCLFLGGGTCRNLQAAVLPVRSERTGTANARASMTR